MKKPLKRLVSFSVTLCMLLNTYFAVYADTDEDPEEEPVIIEESDETEISESIDETPIDETYMISETDISEETTSGSDLTYETELTEQTDVIDEIEDEDVSPDNEWMMETFPDDYFRSYLLGIYDANDNNIFDDDELAVIRSVTYLKMDVLPRWDNTAGIEQFTSLQTLIIERQSTMTELDLSGNTQLQSVTLTSCGDLETVIIGDNPNLTYLAITGSKLNEIDVSGAPNLVELRIYNNDLTSLDVSNNPNLEKLLVNSNSALSSLNVSSCTSLLELNFSGTAVTRIDISDCPYLIGEYINSGSASSSYMVRDGSKIYRLVLPSASTTVTHNFSHVSGTKVDSVTSSSVSLSWNPVQLASGYAVYYNTSSSNKGTNVVYVTDAQASITGLNSQSTYYFWVLPYIEFPQGYKAVYDDTTYSVSGTTSAPPADQVDINSSSVTVEVEEVTYNRTAQTPDVTVKYNGTVLEKGVDYTIGNWSGNTAAGTNTASFVLTGTGNFKGTRKVNFSILPKDISEYEIRINTISPISLEYTGQALKPSAKVYYTDTAYLQSYEVNLPQYADNVNPGMASVTITGKGNYTGSITGYFVIGGKELTDSMVTVSDTVYTGVAAKPVVVVNDGSKTLVEGTCYTVSCSSVNAGTGIVTITGCGSFSGTVTKEFTIEKKPIGETSVSVPGTQTFTGSALTPAVTVTDGDKALTKGTDYTVAYSSNTAVGTATVTITGKGNYTGVTTATFEIVERGVGDLTATVSDQTYTGSALTPQVTVKDGTRTLTKGTDYTLEYKDNVNVGTATVTITGKGNYSSSFTVTFEILPRTLNSSMVTASNVTYNGGYQTPVVVKDGNKLLTAGIDYTVTYTGNRDQGTASATVQGIGNYTGTVSKSFTISRKSVDASDISVSDIAPLVSTGSAITPEPVLTFNGKTLTKNTDYTLSYADNVNPGTATITITGKGNFQGTRTVEFVISSQPLTGLTITVSDVTYTGSALTPAVTVKDGTTTLTEGTNYTVSYSNNVNAGTATVTITGKGRYSGTASTEFNILPKTLTSSMVTVSNTVYTGNAVTPSVIVKDGTVTLDTDSYTVTYSNNVNAGSTAKVTVKGSGNYQGTVTKTFTISKKAISDVTMTLGVTSAVYTGSAIKPACTLTNGSTILKETTDYTVSYTNNINAGTATVTVTGKGNYQGTASKTFTITAADISTGLSVSVNAATYTGSAVTPSFSVSFGGRSLTTSDYTYAFTNNVSAGSGATLTITGKGNYKGAFQKKFTISPKALTAAMVTVEDVTYTGSDVYPVVTVKDGTTVLSNNSYDVSYVASSGTGTGTVTITGKGNYTGSVSVDYNINARSITLADVAFETAFEYTGYAVEPEVVVTDGTNILVSGVDYSVSYENNRNVGSNAVIKITGMGNYTGVATKIFTISPRTLTSDMVTLSDCAYTGSPVVPDVTVSDGDKELVKDTDYQIVCANNTDAGTADITITGKGNYKGSVDMTFTVLQRNVGSLDISLTAEVFTYNGSAIRPGVVVIDGSKTLESGTDYTVSYSSNTNAGTGYVTVKGIGNYDGTKTLSFVIAPASISGAVIDVQDVNYSGSKLEQPVTVTVGSRTLTSSDYSVAYTGDTTNAGTVSITITGKGNYEGKAYASYEISPLSLASATITVSDATYTGDYVTPAATVKLNGKTLVSGTDYTVSYRNNIEAGTYTASVIITGTGNYTGEKSKTFSIVQRSVSSLTVTVSSAVYTGSALTPAVVVKDGTTTLAEGIDYTLTYSNNVNAGSSASVKVTGIGNYKDYISKSFTISPMNLSKVTCEMPVTVVEYTGSALPPSVVLKNGDTTLKANTDYTIAYSNNTAIGTTAKVTITGKGNYTGTLTKTFSIVSKILTGLTVNVENADNLVYTGSEIKPAVTVTDGNYTLTTSDYSVTYKNNKDPGTASIIITGKGNYSGTMYANFTIKKAQISSATVSSIANQSYTGLQITPALTLKYSGRTLVNGTDYTVTYSDNEVPGTAKVLIEGKGNFEGSISKTFKIVKCSVTALNIEVADGVYTGIGVTPDVTVRQNGRILVLNKDYSLSYSDNVNVSSGKVTITGIGNYTGSKTVSFNIAPKDISDPTVEIGINSEEIYTGSAIAPQVEIYDGSYLLAEGEDYTLSIDGNNTNAGTVYVDVTGTGNYKGTKRVSFVIEKRRITGAGLVIAPKEYTGSALKPDVKVVLDGKTLKANTDYVISYPTSVNVGTTMVTVTGTGNYKGTVLGSFEITAKSISSASVMYSATAVYTGNAIKPEVTVLLGGKTLSQGTDYDVTYTMNTNPGTGYIEIKGKNNYTGSITKTFTISYKPLTPADFNAVANSTDSVKLTWTKVANADGYCIMSSTDPNGNYEVVGDVKGNLETTVIRALETGSTYYFKICAYRVINNNKEYSELSDAKSVRLSLPKATDLSFTENSLTSVKVTWSAVEGASSYKVYRSTSSTTGYELVGTVTGTSLTSGDILPNRNYYYKVEAVGDDGSGGTVSGELSDFVIVRTNVGTPTNMKVTSTGSSVVALSWTGISGANVNYEVWRSVYPDMTAQNSFCLGRYSSTSSFSKLLSENTNYYYRVRAYYYYYVDNGEGGKDIKRIYGSYSNIATTKTKARLAAPTVKITKASATSLKLSWNRITGATGYAVYRSESPEGPFTLLTTTKSLTYTNTVTVGKLYYYKVVAYSMLSSVPDYGKESNVCCCMIPATPAGLRAYGPTKTTINLSWTKIQGNANVFYQVWRVDSRTNLPGACIGIYGVNTSSSVSKNLTPGRTYYYRIRAYYKFTDSQGNSYKIFGDYCDLVSGTTKG